MSEPLREAICGFIKGTSLTVPLRIASAKLPFAAAFDIWARAVSSLIVSAASTMPRLSATTEGLVLTIWFSGDVEAGSITMFAAAIISTSMGLGRGFGTG